MSGPVSFDAIALLPVLAPALGAVLVLVLDAIAPRARRIHLPIAAGATALALVAAVAAALGDPEVSRSLCLPAPEGRCFHEPGATGSALQALAAFSGLVVALLLQADRSAFGTYWEPNADRSGRRASADRSAFGTYWERNADGGLADPVATDPATQPTANSRHARRRATAGLGADPAVRAALLLAAVTGAAVVAAGRDLGTWLVGLELATLPVIALVALQGGRRAGHGAFSLMLTSLVSFALLVVGAALWVVATGEVTFGGAGVAEAWTEPSHRPALVVAVLLMVAGLGFKISAVPFHTWTPPAYVGGGPALAALLSTVSKVAALAGLVAVVSGLEPLLGTGNHPHAAALGPALLAGLSMTVGNVIALRQDDLVRFLAWSTIAQSGWLLMPLAGLDTDARVAATAYLGTLVLGSLAAFAAIAHARSAHPDPLERPRPAGSTPDGSAGSDLSMGESRERWSGALRRMPYPGIVLALALLSLAGLPPAVIGLVGKVVALRATLDAGLGWLAAIAVVNVVLGIAAYLRWVAVLLARPGPAATRPTRSSRSTAFALGLAAAALVAASVLPHLLLGLLR